MQSTTSTNSPLNRNETLHELLLAATGVEPVWTCDARANPFGWLTLSSPEQLPDVARALSGKARLCTVTAYAEERDADIERRRIAYHFSMGDTVLTVTVPLYDPETRAPLPVPSITPWFLNADWNEREFAEMFNISIVGHPNMRRLFLDERLDAGIMSKLIPFSAMAHGAASNTLWERVLEAKGVPPEERLPSLGVPAEPIMVEPKFTPVAATEPGGQEAPGKIATLADAAAAAAVEEAAVAVEEAAAAVEEAAVASQEANAPSAAEANGDAGANNDAGADAAPRTDDVAAPPAPEALAAPVAEKAPLPDAQSAEADDMPPAPAQPLENSDKPKTAPPAAKPVISSPRPTRKTPRKPADKGKKK